MTKKASRNNDYVHIPVYMPTGKCVYECVCSLQAHTAQRSTCAICSVWKVHLCGGQDASVSHREAACLALSTPLSFVAQ